MDKRYQVFVSSTYEDLRPERQEIMQALLELDCIPAGMELFPATNEDQWTLIKKVIDDCDYYIVVIGGRYGSIGPAGISYTQMEYEYAVSIGKPAIAFLHKDPETIPAKNVEKSPQGKEKLDAFRSLVQQKLCRFWTSPADLGSAVSRSLVKLIKSNPAIGWVKADLLPPKSATEEILRLRQEIEDLQAQLPEAGETSIVGTEDLAQGNDIIPIRFSFARHSGNSWTPDGTHTDSFNCSWNDLFAVISPLLIDEASDEALRKGLNAHITTTQLDRLQADEKYSPYVLRSFSISANDFNTIKVQFLALRLITKSTKRKTRSVNDKAAYWMLTPTGEDVMINLRAIRKTNLISGVTFNPS